MAAGAAFRQLRQSLKSSFMKFKVLSKEDPAFILLNLGTATGLAGFAMTDPLPLRACSLVSSFSSVIYMLSRPVPLMVPVYWSGLFIAVNTYKISQILYCRAGVELTDMQEDVYMQHFVHSGMRPRQFLTLVSHAKTVEYEPCEVIEEEVKFPSVSTVKLLMKGSVAVRNDGAEMYTVSASKPICFLGDLSALQLSHTAPGTGRTTGGASGNTENSSSGSRKSVSVSELVPENFVSSVYAKDSVITLEWDQDYIIKTLRSNSELGRGLRTVLTSSVMQKVFSVGFTNHNSRYMTLMNAFAVDGQISPMEKKVLKEYELKHGIDKAAHDQGLEVIGWTEEEFQQGYRNICCDRDYHTMESKLSGFISRGGGDRSAGCRVGVSEQQHDLGKLPAGQNKDAGSISTATVLPPQATSPHCNHRRKETDAECKSVPSVCEHAPVVHDVNALTAQTTTVPVATPVKEETSVTTATATATATISTAAATTGPKPECKLDPQQ